MKKYFLLISLMILCVLLMLSENVKAAKELSQSDSYTSSQSQQFTQVIFNNERILFQDSFPAVMRNGRVFVPVRFINDPQIQGQYLFSEYDGEYYLSIYSDYARVNLVIGQSTYRHRQSNDDKEILMNGDLGEAVPYLLGDEPMIPLRAVAEAMGIQVKWDNRTRTAILETNEAYRSELASEEEWAEWMGEYPIDWNDESGKPITEQELKTFIEDNELHIVDYKIDSKYRAVVLEVEENKASTYSIQRLRNGQLGRESVSISVQEDEEGLSVKRSHGYIAVVIYDQAKQHQIDTCLITYYNEGKMEKLKFTIGDKRGYLLPIGEVTIGMIDLYGKDDGFIYEEMFW